MKTIKFIVKIIVAAIVAACIACVLIMHDVSDNAVIVTYFCTAIGVAAVLGVFDIEERKRDTKFDSIRHKQGLHNAA